MLICATFCRESTSLLTRGLYSPVSWPVQARGTNGGNLLQQVSPIAFLSEYIHDRSQVPHKSHGSHPSIPYAHKSAASTSKYVTQPSVRAWTSLELSPRCTECTHALLPCIPRSHNCIQPLAPSSLHPRVLLARRPGPLGRALCSRQLSPTRTVDLRSDAHAHPEPLLVFLLPLLPN
jgi:hypothetical protein